MGDLGFVKSWDMKGRSLRFTNFVVIGELTSKLGV